MSCRRHVSGFCMECGRWRDTLHRDHIVPRWKKGGDSPDNVQWLCANCHEDKTREDLAGLPSPRKGIYGRKHTAETRAKMRIARVGSRPALGMKHSVETRAAYSAARKGAGNPNFGKQHTEEARSKMRAAWALRKLRMAETDAAIH